MLRAMTHAHTASWKRLGLPWLLLLAAPQGAGAWTLPEPDDEVLVAFSAGELAPPLGVGALWNGAEGPPGDAPVVSTPAALAVEILALASAREPAAEAALLLREVGGEVEAALGHLERVLAEARDGVFRANVAVSIRQMEAYADLLAEVAKTLDAFVAGVAEGSDREHRADDGGHVFVHASAVLLHFEAELRESDDDARDEDDEED